MPELLKFETERLLLKATSIEDALFILELMNSPKWIKNIGDRNVRTEEEAIAYIKTKMLPQQERLGFSNYTVIRKSDGIKMGTCGLYDREGLEGFDIGFALLPQYEKQGYAFEASNTLKELAFAKFDINEINAITIKDNLSSQKLLERLGLKLIGPVRLKNDEEELLLYKIRR